MLCLRPARKLRPPGPQVGGTGAAGARVRRTEAAAVGGPPLVSAAHVGNRVLPVVEWHAVVQAAGVAAL